MGQATKVVVAVLTEGLPWIVVVFVLEFGEALGVVVGIFPLLGMLFVGVDAFGEELGEAFFGYGLAAEVVAGIGADEVVGVVVADAFLDDAAFGIVFEGR